MSKAIADFKCGADPRAAEPSDCNWPYCGCDERTSYVIEQLQEIGWLSPDEAKQAIDAAIAAERERCAKIADEPTASISVNAASAEWDAGWIRHGKEIAAAIRGGKP